MILEIAFHSKNPISLVKIKKTIALLKKQKSREPFPVVLHVAFPSKTEMQRLNHYYRKKNKPTDVLSIRSSANGEIFLCLSYIRNQAKANKVPFVEECYRLFIHGLLHLLGFEHNTSFKDAREMFSIQEKIVQNLGFTPREWQKWVTPSLPKRPGTKSKLK